MSGAGKFEAADGAAALGPALSKEEMAADIEDKFLSSFEDGDTTSDLVIPDGPNPNAQAGAIDKEGTQIEDIVGMFGDAEGGGGGADLDRVGSFRAVSNCPVI
jgi:hypothetical protein